MWMFFFVLLFLRCEEGVRVRGQTKYQYQIGFTLSKKSVKILFRNNDTNCTGTSDSIERKTTN